MKIIILLLFTLSAFYSPAQKIEKFYDYNWKECEAGTASFYALIKKTDSGWFRNDYFVHGTILQMQGLYKDNECKIENGTFYYFYSNGILSQKGKYTEGKKEGLWLSYHSNGMMKDSLFYNNGELTGVAMSWHANGFTSDSVTINPDGKSVFISWFDNGTLSSAGYKVSGKLNGKWKYYHSNGQLSAVEVYDKGNLQSREYYNESGVLLNNKTNRDREVSFPGGEKAWIKFVLSKLYFPDQYRLQDGAQVVVMIRAYVDDMGNVKDAEVETPFHKNFDQIAIDVMKKSPAWLPAIDHNRRVPATIRQPFWFSQSSY